MKICYITNARLPTEKAHGLQIMKTCEALSQAGHDVEVLAPKRLNHITEDPFSYYKIRKLFSLRTLFTVDLVRWGRLGFLIQECSFAVAVALTLRRQNIVIYSRDELVLSLLRMVGHTRMIWESHDGSWNSAAQYIARSVNYIVVVTEGLRAFYRERGIDPEKIFVVRNGIELAQFAHPESKSEARTRLDLPGDKKIALYIGRLDGWKGTQTLLEAAKFLDDVCVVLIGGGADLHALRLTYPNVIFLGPRPYAELADNQATADVLVIPNTSKNVISVRFTSPLKLFAHMASGVPIVASDLPSIREIVDEHTAFLVKPDNPQALAEAIKKACTDTSTAQRMAHKARESVKRYSWSLRAERISVLLEKL